MTIKERLNGKRMDVNYETGYHFVIKFLDDENIEWEALSKTAEGAPAIEQEPYVSYEMGEDLYFLSWIEESGLVVSQVDDFKHGKVYAFMTWPDEQARGKRASLLHKGELTIVD